jgi:alpha-1,2-mannosyltransferase
MVWAIGILAFAMRLWSVLHSGGLEAVLGYDEGVYFAASEGLVNGLVPYRDFVLVHPPGILLLLSPLATAARWIGDPAAWGAARVFVMLIGAANAMMITVIGRRAGTRVGLAAGLLYAVWTPAIHVERTTMLEAFVLAGMLVALLMLRTPVETTSRLVVAGSALGAAASTKAWGLIPLLVIVGWLLVARAWRSAMVVSAAALGVAALVVGPFLAMAPRRMVDLVVLAQLERGRGGAATYGRLDRILNLADVDPQFAVRESVTVTVLLAVALAAIAMLAWRLPQARLWVVLLAVQLIVLMSVPVYFAGYSSFAAPALVLVIGAGLEGIRRRVEGVSVARRWVGWTVALAVTGIVAASALVSLSTSTRDFDRAAEVAPLLANARCVGSDSAAMLLAMDVMTRTIQRGCPVVFDVDGSIYDVNAGANPGRLTSKARRVGSAVYQDTLQDYFAASDAVIVHREPVDGMSTATARELALRPVLWHHGNTTVLGAP